ncbi:MAG TPA: tetratricopeptide repeat protein, partial [Chloroflexota bacterium]|nr:tetratricopeptide repeat protein [Chloroflexota bacterium]
LFRRLGVFVGGFTLDRVEAMNHYLGGLALHDVRDSMQELAVIDRLARLVDHNLVQQTHTPDGTIRFSLLETLREFALERLAERREVDDARRQHTLCYAAFVEEAARHLHGANQAHWHAQIEHERHNLRAAILWSVEREERQLALRLVASMWWFWFVRGYFSEGRELLAAALSIPGDSKQPLNTPELADALIGAGFLAEYHAYDSHAQTLVNRGLEVARALADPQRIALASITLGLLASHRARFAEARTLNEQALAHARAAGDSRIMAFSTNNLGHIAYREGKYSTARQLFAEALTLWRTGDDDWGIAMTLNGFGHVALAEQDYVAARAYYEQSLSIRRRLGYTAGIALSLTGLARVAGGEGNITLARSLCKEGWTTAPDWRIIAAHQASTRCDTALANA